METKKTPDKTPEEIREHFATLFKIEDNTAKVMVQESSVGVKFEPLKAGSHSHSESVGGAGSNIRTKVGSGTSHNIKIHTLLNSMMALPNIASGSQWPKKTDILCWWCCHSFDTVPLPCPVSYDSIKDHYKLDGIFCSWSCVAAYSKKEYMSLELVYSLYEKIMEDGESSAKSYSIPIAPPKTLLKSFGGYMSIGQYRNDNHARTLLISTEGLSYVNTEIAEIKG